MYMASLQTMYRVVAGGVDHTGSEHDFFYNSSYLNLNLPPFLSILACMHAFDQSNSD